MTIEDAFKKIADSAFFRIDNDIKFSDNYSELSAYDNDYARTNFINCMINFFGKEYKVDILPIYLDYMHKVNNSFEKKICQFMEE